jgi:hypothetical protein
MDVRRRVLEYEVEIPFALLAKTWWTLRLSFFAAGAEALNRKGHKGKSRIAQRVRFPVKTI